MYMHVDPNRTRSHGALAYITSETFEAAESALLMCPDVAGTINVNRQGSDTDSGRPVIAGSGSRGRHRAS